MSGSDPEALRRRNGETMVELLRRLGSQDFRGACELLTEDVVCDWPYPPMADGPSELRGRETMEAFFSGGMSSFDPYRYEITRVFELVDPDRIIAEYHSNSRFKPSGAPYRNDYLGIFEFQNGLVCYWREYINPVAVSDVLATAK
jgi:ketosteroid isomerase-like protein